MTIKEIAMSIFISIHEWIKALIKPILCPMLLGLFSVTSTHALTFNLPNATSTIVGEVYVVFLEPGESLRQLARNHNMGYEELMIANQHIHPWKPRAWSKVLIPSSFVLPSTKQEGIVINLPEMRLYYYPKDSDIVMTFPIGVGRQGWETPIATTKILEKREDPKWYVPESIQEYMAEMIVPLSRD